jgi:hypothetical protein
MSAIPLPRCGRLAAGSTRERGRQMPKVSKQSAPVQEQGPSRFWTGALDGYKVDLVECNVDTDLTPLLQGLPNDQCPSPHWGYVLKGSIW